MPSRRGSVVRILWCLPAIVGLGLLTWLSFLIPGLQMRRAHPIWFWLAWIFLAGAVLGVATDGALLIFVWLGGIVLYFIMLRTWNRFAAEGTFAEAAVDVIDAATPATGAVMMESAVVDDAPPAPGRAPGLPRTARPSSSPPAESVEVRSGDTAPLVFVSHASADRDSTQVLADELESRGVRTWLAHRDVGVGGNYAEEIVNAIVGADYLLIVLSEAAIESPHIRREVTIGIDRGIPLLPVNMSASEDFMWTLPVDWTYWLSLAQVMRHTDEASTASELARRITR